MHVHTCKYVPKGPYSIAACSFAYAIGRVLSSFVVVTLMLYQDAIHAFLTSSENWHQVWYVIHCKPQSIQKNKFLESESARGIDSHRRHTVYDLSLKFRKKYSF